MRLYTSEGALKHTVLQTVGYDSLLGHKIEFLMQWNRKENMRVSCV